jgi:hypothetical protein
MKFNLHWNNCCRCGRLVSDDCDREDQGPYGRGGGHPQERRGPAPEEAGESLPAYRRGSCWDPNHHLSFSLYNRIE